MRLVSFRRGSAASAQGNVAHATGRLPSVVDALKAQKVRRRTPHVLPLRRSASG